tara:strand:+ start:5246 stop:6178 length:933 start_codon:yes stop_codon:yes gene_type:complete
MKNIFRLLFASLFIVNYSCQDSDNVIDGVLDYEVGAVIRTIAVDNNVVNSSDESSAWLATLEVQDGTDDSSLWSFIELHVEMQDFTPDNGDNSTNSVLLYTWTPDNFEMGPVGLPRADVSANWGDIKAVLNFTGDEYSPGDLLTFKAYLHLNDGRVFGPDSAAGIITGGFFASPFQYNALLTCSPAPGTYTVEMYDGYGDGWQSTGVEVCIDGSCEALTIPQLWPTVTNFGTTTVEVPEGTETLTWTWAGDTYGNEVYFLVYGPNGDLIFAGKGADEMLLYSNGAAPSEEIQAEAILMGAGLLPIALCAG